MTCPHCCSVVYVGNAFCSDCGAMVRGVGSVATLPQPAGGAPQVARTTPLSIQALDSPAPGCERSPVPKLTALLLAWFPLFFCLGGLHRLACGRVFTGLLQFATVGGIFVWQVADAVAIVRGDFRDSRGRLVLDRQPHDE